VPNEPTSMRLAQSLAWRALTIGERLAVAREHGLSLAPSVNQRQKAAACIDLALPGETRPLAASMLALYGSSEEELGAIMDMPPSLRGRRLPTMPWQVVASECLAANNIERSAKDLPYSERDGVFALLRPFRYWAAKTVARLQDQQTPNHWDWPSVLRRLEFLLTDRLSTLAHRTLLLELNVARVTGELQGNTPAERLASFVSGLCDGPRRLRRLYLRYPPLVRLLAEACIDWQRNVTDVVQALDRDRAEIVDVFFGGVDPGSVDAIVSMGSDPHAGGTQVLLVRFAAGRKLVFKPRNLGIDRAFQHVVEWTNTHGFTPPCRTMRVLTRVTYGWTEFIPFEKTDADGVRRHYRRQGAYLALINALVGTDFHAENLISAGEYPYLVDLEALFHAKPDTPSMGSALEFLSESVLSTGLLPNWIGFDPDAPGVDLSGLGHPDGQMTPREVEVTVDLFSDDARIVKRQVAIHGKQNRATTADGPANVCDYAAELIAGFESACAILRRNAKDFFGAAGPFDTYDFDVRQVVRPTLIYSDALSKATHPHYLTDCALRELFFARFFGLSVMRPQYARVAGSELYDLMRGDVPKFTSRPDSRDLYDSRGNKIADFFSRSALEVAKERLEHRGGSYVDAQSELIHLSLVALGGSVRARRNGRRPTSIHAFNGKALSPGEFVDEAVSIARLLHEKAIVRDGLADWIALASRGGEQLYVKQIGVDLYEGTAGVALFLSCLDLVRGTHEFRDVTRQALETAIVPLRSGEPMWGGAIAGPLSVVHALLAISSWTGDDELLELAIDRVGGLRDRTSLPVPDLMAGSAGIITVLLALFARTGHAELLGIAAQFGENLLTTMRSQGSGVAWSLPSVETRAPLTGASHGTAGIALALSHLGQMTGDLRFIEAATAAVAYERSVYVPEVCNWPDFRVVREEYTNNAGGRSCSSAWCHGAPGIVLMRMSSAPGIFAEENLGDVLERMARSPLADSDSLCHGELGNVDTLVTAAEYLNEGRWLAFARQRASDAVRRRRTEGAWHAGVVGAEFAPGLFIGLAGVGFQLLRLAEPDRVPSLLGLATLLGRGTPAMGTDVQPRNLDGVL